MSGVLCDEDVDELMARPDGAMKRTNKRRCVMQNGFELDGVVMAVGRGAFKQLLQRKKPLLPSKLVDSLALGLA